MTQETFTPTPAQLERVKGKRVLVMGSGNGSNFETLVQRLRPYGIDFIGLFCDRPGAKILARALRLGIPQYQPPPLPKAADIHPKRHLNNAVLAFLAQPFDALVLAGYMRILPPRVVQPHQGKILNIHPSLLPAYPGLDAIKRAYEAKERVIGVTIHLVTEDVDDGPILLQGARTIQSGESLAQVEAGIHALEHELYPRALFEFLARSEEQK